VPLEALTEPGKPSVATIPGYGPLPGDLARDIVATSRGRKWWRRLLPAPKGLFTGSGPIVGGDPTRRYFDGWLAQLIELRDPYCDAPIQHIDHIIHYTDGGPTTYANGTCARGNQVREMPGWHLSVIDPGLRGRPHTIHITTPTSHHYPGRAPDPP
jgi:hypothetical protein